LKQIDQLTCFLSGKCERFSAILVITAKEDTDFRVRSDVNNELTNFVATRNIDEVIIDALRIK
jgi:hypothetical protein